MGEIVGRVTCPICGETSQDLKVNKNNKLYCYCDMGCKFTMNSKDSRKILPLLKQGKSQSHEKLGYIRSLCGISAEKTSFFHDEDEF